MNDMYFFKSMSCKNCVFYTGASCISVKNESKKCKDIEDELEKMKKEQNVKDPIWHIINPGKYLILGGHESIGKGIVEVIPYGTE